MLKSLLSKRSQDDTSPFTHDTLANTEIARISSMQNIIFVIHCPLSVCISPKRRYGSIYCGIIIFRGGSIFVVFVDTINHEFTSPTNTNV